MDWKVYLVAKLINGLGKNTEEDNAIPFPGKHQSRSYFRRLEIGERKIDQYYSAGFKHRHYRCLLRDLPIQRMLFLKPWSVGRSLDIREFFDLIL